MSIEAMMLALHAIENGESFDHLDNVIAPVLRTAIEQTEKQEEENT